MINLPVLERMLAVLHVLGIEDDPAKAFTIEEQQNGAAQYICRSASEEITIIIVNLYDALGRPWKSPYHANDSREKAMRDVMQATKTLADTMRFARLILDTPYVSRNAAVSIASEQTIA